MATKQKNNRKAGGKKKQKKSGLPLIMTAVIVLCLAVAILIISRNSGNDNTTKGKLGDSTSGTKTVTSDEKNDQTVFDEAETVESDNGTVSSETEDGIQVIAEGGSLSILVSEISSTVQFYPIEVDGTRMEVLAVKDSEGNIRTAFNTCQICYSSGRGYYVQDGDVLVCQNCGNRFTIDQIEIETGGCNPWPIFEENKTVTDDVIEISYDYLYACKELFANWKNDY